MIQLRPYQDASVAALYKYFETKDGNPLIVLPTGAGKSLTIAAFIKGAIAAYPGTRVLIITHVKELIIQDAKAIVSYWHEAPIGIWSASVGQKNVDQITVAGIQSVHRVPSVFGKTDLVLIDEAHLISKKSDTMYGRFLNGIRAHNKHLKVIGFTATPYRMDSGLLTDGEHRIFTDIAYEANVGDLIKQGYLCPLVAKNGTTKADLSSVHVRGGEFVANELQSAMNKDHLINGALDEVAQYAHDRRHILGFCAGIEHAARCAELSRARGWSSDFVSGDMAAGVRDAKIEDFKSGRTRILFNAMLLTTGFDFPSIDCVLMLRPTKSTGLYCQIMGRGLRKDGVKENTLVLDFAGNVERHGPIDRIKIKSKREGKGEGVSVAPVKECPSCHELVHPSVMECPGCGHKWGAAAPHGTEASEAVIVAATAKPKVFPVDYVLYSRHSKPGKATTLRVEYKCGVSYFNEWIPIEDERTFVRKHAVMWFWNRGLVCPNTVEEAIAMVHKIPAPDTITVRPDGKFWKVVSCDLGSRRMNVSSVPKEKIGYEDFASVAF